MVGFGKDAKADEAKVKAATQIFEEHGTFIRAVIRFQAPSESQEDDLYQQFFLRLVQKPIPASVNNVRSYLYRAIVNDVVDGKRREERHQRYLKKYSAKTRISINKRTLTDAIIEKEELNTVFGFLARHLTRRESQAVTLRYRDDYSVAEIATKMGVDRRTASRYLCSGLKRLRGILAIE